MGNQIQKLKLSQNENESNIQSNINITLHSKKIIKRLKSSPMVNSQLNLKLNIIKCIKRLSKKQQKK